MNSTTGWGEAWGTPGVSLAAGIVLWEMSKMNWSTAKEISGRAYPIPTPSPCWRPSQQHLPGTAPGTGRKPHPCASSCPCPAAFQLLLQAPRGAGRRSPAGSRSRPSTQASAGCSLQREKMQMYPADLELFWHVKEWHCCSKYVEKLGIKLGFFFFLNNIYPRAHIMHWNEEISRQVGGNPFNIFSAACWPSLCVGCR